LWFDWYQAPAFRKPQRDKPGPDAKANIKEKLTTALERRYFEEGLVKSLTAFFGLPKGDFDMRMVYDSTLSGVNNAIWAPLFSFPNINTLLRIFETGTLMGDADIG
jgi:hypothetical protein